MDWPAVIALKVTADVSVTALLFKMPCIGMVSPVEVLNEAVTAPAVSALMVKAPLFKNAPLALKLSLPWVIASRVVLTVEVISVAALGSKLVSLALPSLAA